MDQVRSSSPGWDVVGTRTVQGFVGWLLVGTSWMAAGGADGFDAAMARTVATTQHTLFSYHSARTAGADAENQRLRLKLQEAEAVAASMVVALENAHEMLQAAGNADDTPHGSGGGTRPRLR